MRVAAIAKPTVNHAHCRGLNGVRPRSAACTLNSRQRQQATRRRLRFLDGLRGWAAVVVLLHHVFVDGLPANGLMADRSLWAKVFFLNGTLAVCVFFVISGFSLSIRYLETRRWTGADAGSPPDATCGWRVPIFAICAITYALLVFGFIPPAAFRPPPLDAFLTFTPTLEQLLSFSLLACVRRLFGRRDLRSAAMDHELRVLRLVHGVCGRRAAAAVRGSGRWRWACCSRRWQALQSFFALFVAGILIADVFLLACGRLSPTGPARRFASPACC